MRALPAARAAARTWLWPALGLGMCALLLGSLANLFRVEAREAKEAVDAQRAALQGFVAGQFQSRLKDRLTAARRLQEAARRNPLLDDSRVALSIAGERVLPVLGPWRGTGSMAHHLEPSEPATERFQLISGVSRARGRAEVERATRLVLAHMAAHRLDVMDEVEATTRLFAALGPTISPQLANALLRDGLRSTPGGPVVVEPLFLTLLRSTHVLSDTTA